MQEEMIITLSDIVKCSSSLRRLGKDAHSMEEVADRIVGHLYNNLVDKESGSKYCALLRFYKTHPFEELGPNLREFAGALLEKEAFSPPPMMKCLTLLATAGDKPEWNSRKESKTHKAIPLPSKEVVASFPMIAQLINHFGVEVSSVIDPNPDLLMDMDERSYNVFYVSEALGSPFVPDQDDFVIPFGIKSVLGFGGMLPCGDLFATILFSRAAITPETANMFKTLALSIKTAILPYVGKYTFSQHP